MSQSLSEFNLSYLNSKKIEQSFILEIDGLVEYHEVTPLYDDMFLYDDTIRYDKRTLVPLYDENILFTSNCIKRTPTYNDEFFYDDEILYDDFVDSKNQKCLIDLKGETSKTLSWQLRSAEASSTSIGSFKVELTDKNQIITQLFNPSTGGEIIGRKAFFYVALGGNYEEKILLHSGIITELKSKSGSVTLNISDSNFIAKKKLFSENENESTNAMTAISTTVNLLKNKTYPMPNGSNFELYIRIEDELMRVVSQVGNTLNVIRAQYGTIAVVHGAEQTINFFYRIFGNPFDISVALLSSIGLPFGAGVPMDLIDTDKIYSIRDFILPSVPPIDCFVGEEITVKEFIEKEILLPIGCYSLPKIGGKFSIGVLTPPLLSERVTLDCCNIVNPDKLVIERSLSRNFYNVISYKFDKDQVEDKFTRGRIEISPNFLNVIEFGEKYLDIDAKYYRNLDADNFFDYTADKLLDRYSLGVEFIAGVKIQYSVGVYIDIGDVVVFDGSQLFMSEFKDSQRVYKPKLMEVVNKSINFVTGECTLDLLNTAYSLNGRFGIISLSANILNVTPNSVQISSIDSVSSVSSWIKYIGEKVIIYSKNNDFSAFNDCIEVTIQSVVGDIVTFVENPIDVNWSMLNNYDLVLSISNYSSASENTKNEFVFLGQTQPCNVTGSLVDFGAFSDLPTKGTLIIHDDNWNNPEEIEIISKTGNSFVLKSSPIQQGNLLATIGAMTSDDGLPYRYI